MNSDIYSSPKRQGVLLKAYNSIDMKNSSKVCSFHKAPVDVKRWFVFQLVVFLCSTLSKHVGAQQCVNLGVVIAGAMCFRTSLGVSTRVGGTLRCMLSTSGVKVQGFGIDIFGTQSCGSIRNGLGLFLIAAFLQGAARPASAT